MKWLIPFIEVSVIRIFVAVILLIPKLNMPLGNVSYMIPDLDGAAIFFWTIASPNMFNMYVLVILGIYFDIITGLPLGFNSLIYLIFYYCLLYLVKFFINTSFFAYWVGFSIFSLFFIIAKYLTIMAYEGEFFIPQNLFIKWLVLLFLYPYIHILFSKVRQILITSFSKYY